MITADLSTMADDEFWRLKARVSAEKRRRLISSSRVDIFPFACVYTVIWAISFFYIYDIHAFESTEDVVYRLFGHAFELPILISFWIQSTFSTPRPLFNVTHYT